NFDFSFGEEFSPRIQVFHASTCNTLPLLANLDGEVFIFAETAMREARTLTSKSALPRGRIP
ncbi:hypothetical protein, partial [Citrobacter freundii]|uniref:hypothetical protein n=1 Tax=Citrobacter freundii TaxID=546 RepID=UPI001C30CF36